MTKNQYSALPETPTPQVLRLLLEEVVLRLHRVGLVHTHSQVVAFLRDLPEAPPSAAVDAALNKLQLMGATHEGRLTLLGQCVSQLSFSPSIALNVGIRQPECNSPGNN